MTSISRQKIASVEQLDNMRKQYKERLGGLDTNCYSGITSLADSIEAERVAVSLTEQGLLVFVDEGSYERLFYYLRKQNTDCFPRVSAAKPTVLEELDSSGRRGAYIELLGERLAASGWRMLARNLQVSSALDGRRTEIEASFQASKEGIMSQGLRLGLGTRENSDEVIHLWKQYLRPSDIPRIHLAFAEDENQRVICAINDQGAVCGVNWWSYRGLTCEVRHTVTHPDYLHRGIAYSLLMASLYAACQDGCAQATTFIDQENSKSLHLYEKAGITVNGRTSTQFLLDS